MSAGGARSIVSRRTWLLALACFACWSGREALAQGRQAAMVGKHAPPFQIQGIFHEAYSLETFKGHILVMQFGSSW